MTFAAIAALCGATAVLMMVLFPRVVPVSTGSLRSQAAILKRGKIFAYLTLSAVIFTAMFAGYTYLADVLSEVTGFDGITVGWILMGSAGSASWATGPLAASSIEDRSLQRFSRPAR